MARDIYLDYAATGIMLPQAREAYLHFSGDEYGNASGNHVRSRRAKAALSRLRRELADLLGCKAHEILFTSGGSEANNLAIKGSLLAQGLDQDSPTIFYSALEHPSVIQSIRQVQELKCGRGIEIPLDESGGLEISKLADRIRGGHMLTLMAVNNELGFIQPIEEISYFCRQAGVLFHCDAVQAATTMDLKPLVAASDSLSLSAHKFGGPLGVGILILKENVEITPLITGGSQENARRAGTENLPAIAGMIAALKQTIAVREQLQDQFQALEDALLAELKDCQGKYRYFGANSLKTPHICSFLLHGHYANDILMKLDLKGICAASGSACSTGNPEPSPLLLAMGIPAEEAKSLLRFSFGPSTTLEEVQLAGRTLAEILKAGS